MRLFNCFFFLLSLAVSSLSYGKGSEEVAGRKLSLFEAGDHCVAYRTGNRMALFVVVKVVGKNCSISTLVLPALEDKYIFEVRIPISNFNSNETERDSDVVGILGVASQPNVVFRSEALGNLEWKKILEGGKKSLSGTLSIAKRSFKLAADIAITKSDSGFEVDGIVKSQFVNFGIQPPELVGGIGARVESWLELHFHLLSKKTLGFHQLVNGNATVPLSQ